ncbi:MAG: carotenoid biosynthesis protein [Verrucomicrobiales bacterium]
MALSSISSRCLAARLLLAGRYRLGGRGLRGRTGFPFGGRYVYRGAFRPQLPREVPVAIPLAWYVLVRLPVVLLRRSEMPLWSKSMLCGIFIAGCALLLDPLGQSIGLWKFAIDDGIVLQATNALGWGSVSFLITACYFGSAKHNIRIPTSAQRQLEVLLLTMAGFFLLLALAAGASRLNAIGPLTISLALMLPCWICWWRTFQRLATFDALVQEDAR